MQQTASAENIFFNVLHEILPKNIDINRPIANNLGEKKETAAEAMIRYEWDECFDYHSKNNVKGWSLILIKIQILTVHSIYKKSYII